MSNPRENAGAQDNAHAKESQEEGGGAAELLQLLQEQVELHPLKALALAAGLGFVIGRGMFGRVAGGLVTKSVRAGLAASITPLVARFAEHLFDAGAQRGA